MERASSVCSADVFSSCVGAHVCSTVATPVVQENPAARARELQRMMCDDVIMNRSFQFSEVFL